MKDRGRECRVYTGGTPTCIRSRPRPPAVDARIATFPPSDAPLGLPQAQPALAAGIPLPERRPSCRPGAPSEEANRIPIEAAAQGRRGRPSLPRSPRRGPGVVLESPSDLGPRPDMHHRCTPRQGPPSSAAPAQRSGTSRFRAPISRAARSESNGQAAAASCRPSGNHLLRTPRPLSGPITGPSGVPAAQAAASRQPATRCRHRRRARDLERRSSGTKRGHRPASAPSSNSRPPLV